MDDIFIAIEARRGFIARRDVLDLGLDDRFIRAQITSRVWVRVRKGAYCTSTTWRGLDEHGRARIHALAVLDSLGDGVVLSHQSRLLFEPDLDLWGIDLSRTHVTRRDGRSGGIEGDVVHHSGTVSDELLVENADGVLLIPTALGVIQTVSNASVEAGMASADSALHHGRVLPEELSDARDYVGPIRGSRRIDLVLRLADGRAASVGESRTRYLCWSQGLPKPELQFEVYDEDGNLIGITDLAWPALRLLAEFDGKVKYGRLLKPGQEPGDVVFEEKKREDALRRVTGYSMLRVTWDDLYRPKTTADRARGQMSPAA